jgi:hypothetical protein
VIGAGGVKGDEQKIGVARGDGSLLRLVVAATAKA